MRARCLIAKLTYCSMRVCKSCHLNSLSASANATLGSSSSSVAVSVTPGTFTSSTGSFVVSQFSSIISTATYASKWTGALSRISIVVLVRE